MTAIDMRGGLRRFLPYAFLPFAAVNQRLRPCIRILMYHRVAQLGRYDQLTVTPARFDEQMAELRARWRVISLAQAVAELASGKVEAPGVVITFDDGYRDNLVHALPILRRYGLPATIFVVSGFCEGQLRHPRYPEEDAALHLSWQEVAQLAKEPGIDIGSHSQTHPFLTRLSDAAVHQEIVESRKELSARLGMNIDFFCYPSGDLTPREVALVASAGYRAAVSVCPGANRSAKAPFALRRTEVTDRDGPRELGLKLRGAYDPIHRLLHWRREHEFQRARPSAGRGTESGSVE